MKETIKHEVSSQLDYEELRESYEMVSTLFSPAKRIAAGSAHRLAEREKKKIAKKVVERSIKRRAKKVEKKVAKETVKKTTKEVTKKTAEVVAETAAKTAATVATEAGCAAAGSVAGPVGFAIGLAIGKVAGEIEGEKIERRFAKKDRRAKVMRFANDKLIGDDERYNQTNGVKLASSLLWSRLKNPLKKKGKNLLALLIAGALIVTCTIMPGVVIVCVLYNLPISIFLPRVGNQKTVVEVTEDYFSESIKKVKEEISKDNYDRLVLNGVYELYDMKNEKDIVIAYMVKNGVGDMASVMNDKQKKQLKAVYNYMVTVETKVTKSKELKYRKVFDKDGKVELDENGKVIWEEYTVSIRTKTIKVSLKYLEDAAEKYEFDEEQRIWMDVLNEMEIE